jgi:hypothetical protein
MRDITAIGDAMNHPFQIAPGPIYSGSTPVRDAKYRAFIRRQASVVSGFGPCDPCHTGPHAAGQKSSDLHCIPLTRREHERFDADPHGFAAHHQLDIPNLIAQFNELYQIEVKGRAA